MLQSARRKLSCSSLIPWKRGVVSPALWSQMQAHIIASRGQIHNSIGLLYPSNGPYSLARYRKYRTMTQYRAWIPAPSYRMTVQYSVNTTPLSPYTYNVDQSYCSGAHLSGGLRVWVERLGDILRGRASLVRDLRHFHLHRDSWVRRLLLDGSTL